MKIKFFIIAVVLSLFTAVAFAEDELTTMAIQDAMDNPKVQSSLYEDIALYWGSQGHPDVIKNFGEFKTSKRANKLGKSRESACQWALASAVKALQQRARKEGGNAVINIRSNVLDNEVSSETSYECLCGGMMVNVAVKGDVVKLAK
ncbi:hypothetical protein [uncultured Desulfobacter sp.]|uniref:hypothetical protein n=1 Tax=uncultured Desulfobacter sp. TaxID=240139 RepID=UPI002AABDAC4|nr:hypothetical protein [uncultured Desulfobacter sp.]